MREYKKWAYEVRLFDSVTDLLAQVKAVPEARCTTLNAWRDPAKCGRPFRSWQDVWTAVEQPWEAGLREVERMTTALRDVDLPQPVCRVRRICYRGDDGDEVDRDRLAAGQDYWRSSHRPLVEGEQVVTLVVDVNARKDIPSQAILWRGAAALAMTTVLEEAGYRVEIWLAHRADEAYADGHGHFHAVQLKVAPDLLDLSTLTGAVSGWFYRSVLLRAKCLSARPLAKDKGQPYPPMSLLDELRAINPILISGTYSFTGALAVAREALQRFATPTPPPEPEPEAELEQVNTVPAAPPKPLTPVQQRREEAARQRAQKQLDKARKEWAKINREE